MERITAILPLLPIAALVFQAGSQSQRLSEVINTAHMLEAENKGTKEMLYDIHGKLCTIESDIKNIKHRLEK